MPTKTVCIDIETDDDTPVGVVNAETMEILCFAITLPDGTQITRKKDDPDFQEKFTKHCMGRISLASLRMGG